MDNAKAILFVRGERPIMDDKYELSRHPHIRQTSDGGASPFIHGSAPCAVASIAIEDDAHAPVSEVDQEERDVVALTEREVQEALQL